MSKRLHTNVCSIYICILYNDGMDWVIHSLKRRFRLAQNGLPFQRRSPDVLMGDLFHDVQVRRIFPDSITFVDMVPPKRLNSILKLYKEHRYDPDFDLAAFVNKHFVPVPRSPAYKTNKKHSVEEHIEEIWDVLYREQHRDEGSLIGLPYPYIVAGGRYQTLFYWDSYFVMLGLAAGGHWDMVEHMVDNFAFMLRKYGHIPNGSRTYYIGRSQPPFFALMVRLLAEQKGKQTFIKYLPHLLIEHKFWMKGDSDLSKTRQAINRVVRMPDGEVLNRYFDNKSAPRPEGYIEDLAIILKNRASPSKQYVNLRAAAESGWDFSSRWLADGKSLSTARTIDIVPVDLNSLLVLLEETIALAYTQLHQKRAAGFYTQLAKSRKAAIRKYCWHEVNGFFFDYSITKSPSRVLSLAGVFPLYAGVATEAQAQKVAQVLEKRFLKPGGLPCTLTETGEQWDSPNGWAPLHWVAIRGLRKYKHTDLADTIKTRWIKTNTQMFKTQGKLVEKYNVVNTKQSAGGGEYVLQDGFGWTNGVLLALLHEDAIHWE